MIAEDLEDAEQIFKKYGNDEEKEREFQDFNSFEKI